MLYYRNESHLSLCQQHRYDLESHNFAVGLQMREKYSKLSHTVSRPARSWSRKKHTMLPNPNMTSRYRREASPQKEKRMRDDAVIWRESACYQIWVVEKFWSSLCAVSELILRQSLRYCLRLDWLKDFKLTMFAHKGWLYINVFSVTSWCEIGFCAIPRPLLKPSGFLL